MDTTALFNYAILAVLVVLIIFMFRNSRKRKAAAEELKSQIQPGVEVMTNFGLFGVLKSIDEGSNVAELETSPGTIVRVHRQTIARVVTDAEASGASTGAPRSVEEAMAIANREAAEREAELNVDHAIPAADPEYGERVVPEKKPRTRAKKAAE
ncbi:MAG: preprotein translocase subunit YajC [Actinomycetota bacterium]|nr:preprotein translocase subunit YajC [Actinomycetota bacterium]